jgi:hypothetical protein
MGKLQKLKPGLRSSGARGYAQRFGFAVVGMGRESTWHAGG